MNVKEAIEILKDENRDICYGTTLADEATKLAVEIMERTRWIPVSERLPKFYEEVLCYQNICDGSFVVGEYSENGTWGETYSGEYFLIKVTHWMPLPEPPQQEVE